MPFDGIGYEGRIDTLDKMDKVIDLIGDERRWCKKVAQTLDGRRCILGAMTAANATIELKEPILVAIKQVTGRDYRKVELLNDSPSTSHGLVLRVPAPGARQHPERPVGGAPPAPTVASSPPWTRMLRPWIARLERLFA